MILAPDPVMIVPVMIATQAMEISLDPIVMEIAIQATEISLDLIVMAIQAMEISSIPAPTPEEMDGMVVTVTGNMIKSNLEFLFICLGKFHDYTDSWG